MPTNFGILSQIQTPQAQVVRAPMVPGITPQQISGALGSILQKPDQSGAQTPYSAPVVPPGSPTAIAGQSVLPTPTSGIPQQPQAPGTLPSLTDIYHNAATQLGAGSHSPTMAKYLQKANPGLDPNTTPWCAGFVNSVLNASGAKGTGSLAAKSYLNYGTKTDQPTKGDIVVFNDLTGQNRPSHGHVGFVDHIDQKTGTVTVLGGNQGGAVSVKTYPLSKVAGFRVPPTGQEVQQYAQQNNIQDPKQLADVPNQINSQDQAEQ